MKLTKNFLEKNNACYRGLEWFCNQKETELIPLLKKLMTKRTQTQIEKKYSENSLEWASWLIVRKMKYKQYVSYAVYAAEQVIDIYEKKYPNNDSPRKARKARKAIEAAKKCIENPSKKNKEAAAVAYANAVAAAVAAAADVTYAADAAADVAAAAYAAADAADAADAAYAAYAAYAYANDAANDAVNYVAANSDKMRKKILKYGIKILLGEVK